MWPWPGRPSRNIPQVNYAESDSEEDFEENLNFNSPLQSPTRPPQSPSASPRALLQPDPPPIEETLQKVNDKLEDLKDAVDVIEGHIKVEADNSVQEGNENPVMATPFDTENGTDDANALREALKYLERLEWEQDDILFWFGQAEIKMSAVGVKKQFTKFQVLSTVIPKKVLD